VAATKGRHYDIDQLKAAARGRWAEILTGLGGLPADILDGSHHACPICKAGKDRFRFDKQREFCVCSQCFSEKNGDGLAALQWAKGWSFSEALSSLADYLGIEPTTSPSAGKRGRGQKYQPMDTPETTTNIDPAILHKAYAHILGRLTLSEFHRQNLRDRGLSDEQIDKGGYRTWPADWKDPEGKQIRDRLALEVSMVVGKNVERIPGIVSYYRRNTLTGPAGLAVPIRNAQGQIIAVKIRRDVADNGSNRYTWLSSRNPKRPDAPSPGAPVHVPVGVPERIAQSKLARATEGGLKADVATGLNCVPTIGADSAGLLHMAVGSVKGMGAEVLRFAPDADFRTNKGVLKGLRKAVESAREKGLAVELETWDAAEAKGIDDALSAGKEIEIVTGDAVQQLIDEFSANLRLRPEGDSQDDEDNRPEVEITTDEETVANAAIEALAARTDVFQRGGLLVQTVRDDDPPKGIRRPIGAPRIAMLARPTIRERLASSVRFVKKIGEKGSDDCEIKICHPPEWCVNAVEARGSWRGIPRLELITEVPVFTADGEVLQKPGFDPRTGIIFAPEIEFPRAVENPSIVQVKAAVAEIFEAVTDFPFARPADQSAWLATVLSVIGRLAYSGPTPTTLTDANVRGCGKSMLVDVAAIIATGRESARTTAPSENEEARKLITSICLEGIRFVNLDNADGPLGCGVLDAAWTASTWSDRLLGTNRMVSDVPLLTVWCVTANNCSIRADTARRVLWCRLESPLESPEERGEFRHPDLIPWVKQNRARLAIAGATILRGYHVAGRPSMGLVPLGSYEGWSALIRSAVVWAGCDDPASTRKELEKQSDRDVGILRLLMRAWQEIDKENRGMTVVNWLDAYTAAPDHYPASRAAIAEVTPAGRNPNANSIGMRLHHLRRRVLDGMYFDKRDAHRGGATWFLGTVESCTTSTGCMTISSLTRAMSGETNNRSFVSCNDLGDRGRNCGATGASGADQTPDQPEPNAHNTTPDTKQNDRLNPRDREILDDFMSH